MASVVGSEVEIQEVEIETIPVEMPIETVETMGDETIEVQPMIALQPLPEPIQEEVVLQTREEIVGDPSLVYVDDLSIPVPAPEIEISTEEHIINTKRGKGGKKKGGRGRGLISLASGGAGELVLDASTVPRKWEQKQVQIKTLEGEFSVTMWASGEYLFFC